MVQSYAGRVLCWAILVSLAVAVAVVAQPALGAKRAGAGRPSYAPIATPEQREKMDKIRDEYKPKIEALRSQIKSLRAQLKGLQKERDDKMAAVLTPPEEKKSAADAAKNVKETPAKPAKKTPPSAAPTGETPAKAGETPAKAGDTPAK